MLWQAAGFAAQRELSSADISHLLGVLPVILVIFQRSFNVSAGSECNPPDDADGSLHENWLSLNGASNHVSLSSGTK
jgi:hypothetical protein